MKQNYSSFAGQMQLNARAGRIAELNALNNLIRGNRSIGSVGYAKHRLCA